MNPRGVGNDSEGWPAIVFVESEGDYVTVRFVIKAGEGERQEQIRLTWPEFRQLVSGLHTLVEGGKP